MRRRWRGEAGFALVGAIFLLVVLAVLGTVMVKVSGMQSRTGTLALQTAQAYHAARSGLEWGIFRAVNAGVCPAGITNITIENYSVDVTCQAVAPPITEGGQTVQIYNIAALAQQGVFGAPDYVSRRLQATVTGTAP